MFFINAGMILDCIEETRTKMTAEAFTVKGQ